MTSPIIDFIEARLDEDEEAANKAVAVSSPRWIDNGSLLMYIDDSPTPFAECLASVDNYMQDDSLGHIARHDPARVLREVAAKRAITETVSPCPACLAGARCVPHDASTGVSTWRPGTDAGERALKLLAAIYSDHPDYNPDWNTT